MYQKYFSQFLKLNEGSLHFAGHSHHYWPDVSREAHIKYWDDSARLVDDKWGHIFGSVIPETQELLSKIIGFSTPQNICFAPNTHELLYRIISSIEKDEIKILTSDSEFYSFERQAQRLEESGKIKRKIISTQNFNDFEKRFTKESHIETYDIIFVSQVFFNSANAIKNLESFVQGLNKNSLIVIDGYHGFMAVDTDLSNIQNDIFYLAGSYKYAAGGEGCCFVTIPKDCQLRPSNTGWFAEIDSLANKSKEVQYSNNGMRFAGATMDFSALYRLHGWLSKMKADSLTQSKFHQYVSNLQKSFLTKISHSQLAQYLITDQNSCGHFLAFALPSTEQTLKVVELLKANKILTDSRKNVLRFGFTIYLDEDDIFKCSEAINGIKEI